VRTIVAKAITFPKEFEHHFFRDADKEILFISIITYVTLVIFFQFMASRDPMRMTVEDIKRYTEVIYRVKATPKKVEKVVATAETGAASEEEVEVVEEEKPKEVVEAAPVSEVTKKEIREEKRSARRDRQEKRRAKIKAAANKMKILAGATAKGGRRTRGSSADREALGLSAGGVEGYDVKKMAEIVGDAGRADKVKKIRGTGAITEDIGDFDIGELKDIAAGDLDMMFKETSVELSRSAITVKGRGAKAKGRQQSELSEIIMKKKNLVTYCYWTSKRRDSSLKGRVVVEFTINPAGEVIRVRFRKSEWGGNRLGKEVERCIKNTIMTWRFEPIDESGGNVTTGALFNLR